MAADFGFALQKAATPPVVAVSGARRHGVGDPCSRTRAQQIRVEGRDAARVGTGVGLFGEIESGQLMWVRQTLGRALRAQTSVLLDTCEKLLTHAATVSRTARVELVVTSFGGLAQLRRRFGLGSRSFTWRLLESQGIVRAQSVHAHPGDHGLDIDRYVAVLSEPVAAWLRGGRSAPQ